MMIDKLQQQIKDLQHKQSAAHIHDALEAFPFKNPKARTDMAELLSSKVRPMHGELAGPNGESLAEFLQREYQARPYLHKPTSPAPASNPDPSPAAPAAQPKSRTLAMEDITPTMSREEQQRAWSAINAAVKER